MRIHYALFDPATDTGGGNYWTWADKALSKQLLSRFYSEFVSQHLAPEPNKLGRVLWGGIVHLAAESPEKCGWLVLYREFDGGCDRQSRPNRFVILTAWIHADNVYESIVPIFNNKTFQYVSQRSRELPVSPPPSFSNSTDETQMWPEFKKFAPFVNPRWDSHLQIEDKPSGMDVTESESFTRELEERFKEEREDKRIKLQLAKEQMCAKEESWKKQKDTLSSQIANHKETIRDKNSEINRLKTAATVSHWLLLLGGSFCGAFLMVVLPAAVRYIKSINFGDFLKLLHLLGVGLS